MTTDVLLRTDLAGKTHEGKVRDMIALDDERLLMVATDRISVFDVVMPNGIPRKGEVLTRLSQYWFDRTADVIPNHMIAVVEADNAAELGVPDDPSLIGRSMVVHRAKPLPVECVVRGYITGSGWADYQRTGSVSGIELPSGLVQAQELFDPIFTPTTKAAEGHDEPISYAQVEELIGPEVANVVKLRSLALYRYGAEVARERGIIIADTKFEFGELDGEIVLIDEALTPDSSRFWPADRYEAGRDQPSFDKQPVRDWAASTGWDKTPPGPELPPEVVEATSQRYVEAYRLLTGEPLPGSEG